MRRLGPALILVILAGGLPAGETLAKKTKRSDRNVTIEISYGVVESVETVKLKSKAGTGAALGALITQLATRHKAQSFVIRRRDGSEIKVIIDHDDEQVLGNSQQQAADRQMAKQLLLDAQTEQEVEQAATKVKVLCH